MTRDEMETVRVGIVGLGGIGTYHAERIVELGHDLVGGMDVSPKAREEFARQFDVATFESYEELFNAGTEALVVTTPNRYHEEYVVAALEADVDVLVEKPLAHNLESAEAIAAAARESDAAVMVGFNNRFAPAAQVFKAKQTDGRFGDLTHVEANYVRRRGVPGRGSWFTSKTVAGGGALIDIGVHALDLALHFLDFPDIVEVMGTTRSDFGPRDDYTYIDMWGEDLGPEGFDVDDSSTALIRCAGGQTVALDVAWAANRDPDEEIIVTGTEAGARFDRSTGDLTIYDVGSEGASHFRDATIETHPEDTHLAELRAFFDAVRTGDPPQYNTVEQALDVQRVVDAIYRSAEEGRAVRLD